MELREVLKNHLDHPIFIEKKISINPISRVLHVKCDSCKHILFKVLSSDADYIHFVAHLHEYRHNVKIIEERIDNNEQNNSYHIKCDSCNEIFYTLKRQVFPSTDSRICNCDKCVLYYERNASDHEIADDLKKRLGFSPDEISSFLSHYATHMVNLKMSFILMLPEEAESTRTSENKEQSTMNINEAISAAIHLDNRKANVIQKIFHKAIRATKEIERIVGVQSDRDTIGLITNRIIEMQGKYMANTKAARLTDAHIDFVLMEAEATKNARIVNSIKRVIWGHEINKPCNCDSCKLQNSEIPKIENPEIKKPQNPKFQILRTYILQNPKTVNRMKLYKETIKLLTLDDYNSLQSTINLESYLHDYYMTGAIKPDNTIDYSHANYHTLETLIKDNITSIDDNYDQNYSMIIAHEEQSYFKQHSVID